MKKRKTCVYVLTMNEAAAHKTLSRCKKILEFRYLDKRIYFVQH